MDNQNNLNSSLSGLPPELIAMMYDDSLDIDIINRYFSSMENADSTENVTTDNNRAKMDIGKIYNKDSGIDNRQNNDINIKMPNRPIKKKNRCKICNRKVGMLGFECRCEDLFCSKHRYPDEHNCCYDYKTNERKRLLEENPKIVAEKIRKI